jgi:hypothetical protein
MGLGILTLFRLVKTVRRVTAKNEDYLPETLFTSSWKSLRVAGNFPGRRGSNLSEKSFFTTLGPEQPPCRIFLRLSHSVWVPVMDIRKVRMTVLNGRVVM